MKQIVFVRNVNAGQKGHPSTGDLVGAFVDAGFVDVWSFQSNGTLVVEPPSENAAGPADAVDEAMQVLAARTGLEREAFAMSSEMLVRVVTSFDATPTWTRRELTLHAGDVIDPVALAVRREAAHRRCRIIATGPSWTVLENERDRESNATPVVERITGSPATSRGFPTLRRLIAKLG